MTRREQTKAIKKALQEAGHPVVSVKHGTGTAREWIHIKLDIDWQERNAISGKVEQIAAKISGRESCMENCIMVGC